MKYPPVFRLTEFSISKKLTNNLNTPPSFVACEMQHYGYYYLQKLDVEELILELKEVGLKGIEVYYPMHTEEDISKFKELARKYDLVESGGSDWHGEITSGDKIGCVEIPFSVLENIKERLKKNC